MHNINNYNHQLFLFPVNTVGCRYTNKGIISLECGNSQGIQVVDATVGWSSQKCRGRGTCCPSETDRRVTEDIGVKYLQNICDGRQKCDIKVITWEESDYESINYICKTTGNPIGKLALGYFSDRFIFVTLHDCNTPILLKQCFSVYLSVDQHDFCMYLAEIVDVI